MIQGARIKQMPEQAKEEMRLACEAAPKIFGVKKISFSEARSLFGDKIENEGLDHHSRVMLIIAMKGNMPRLEEVEGPLGIS